MGEARALARAAFLAMLENWPGMKDYSHPELGPHIILPLTEASDEK
jgi:hypothetical protein